MSWNTPSNIVSAIIEEDLSNLLLIGSSPYECMPDVKFSAEGVKKQLLKIKIYKASGPDLIPARILRDAASGLTTVLFQQSYDSGTLPYAWKLANICAIFKKDRKADPKNYRPVSLTSLKSKVMEHIVPAKYHDTFLQIASSLLRTSMVSSGVCHVRLNSLPSFRNGHQF